MKNTIYCQRENKIWHTSIGQLLTILFRIGVVLQQEISLCSCLGMSYFSDSSHFPRLAFEIFLFFVPQMKNTQKSIISSIKWGTEIHQKKMQ